MTVTVELATDVAFAPAIAEVAAATFPLACPPSSSPADIAAFIASNLTSSTFAEYLASPDSDVLIARSGVDGPIVGYCLIHHRAPQDPDVAAVVTAHPVTELSKMYVLADHHAYGTPTDATPTGGPSPSAALMAAALEEARARGSVLVWLGVNQENQRAQRFYAKSGFTRAGVKTFNLGDSVEHDFIYTHSLA